MEASREARSSILVISNDAAVRDMLANLLSGEGFHVALAGSGAEALKIAANASFDHALVELFLPDTSGVEFKRRLARVSPKTRIVVLSSFTTIRSSDDVLRLARPTSSSTRGKSSNSFARSPRRGRRSRSRPPGTSGSRNA